jgi:hypothetical protein
VRIWRPPCYRNTSPLIGSSPRIRTRNVKINSLVPLPIGTVRNELERMIGIEPTTNCLEGSDSTAELHPQKRDRPSGIGTARAIMPLACLAVPLVPDFGIRFFPQNASLGRKDRSPGAQERNRTAYARLFRAPLYQ